jgi:hypothetical protein
MCVTLLIKYIIIKYIMVLLSVVDKLKEYIQHNVDDVHSTNASLKESVFNIDIDTPFKLPIYTIEDTDSIHSISSVISEDLEINSGDSNVYSILFGMNTNDNNDFAKALLPHWNKIFTSNVEFLIDSQHVIKNIHTIFPVTACDVKSKKLIQNWNAVKNDPQFCEHYGFLEWNMVKEFNKSQSFLQALSIAHILSPLMSFFIPLLFLIFPFILLKIQSVPISFLGYIDILKSIAKHHFIGKAIVTFESFNITNFIYMICMLGVYLLQMYQNTIQCLRFYKNTQKINNELCEWKSFCNYSIQNMEAYLYCNSNLKSHALFCKDIRHYRLQLYNLTVLLSEIVPFQCSIGKTVEIGYMLKCYYELYESEEYKKAIQYAVGFDGYIHLLYGIANNIKDGNIGFAELINQSNNEIEIETDDICNNSEIINNEIEEQYYPMHINDDNNVKNSVHLQNNIVITGPNASGKTTYLKSTAINILLSQQFGVGFYKSCRLVPYDKIHSYLNIPDTSARDSLFQAESRRCRDILTSITESGPNKRHFCIFDELYSGTNPIEASKSAYAFMEYIRSHTNVDLLLTTHYSTICEKWKDETNTSIANVKKIINKQMEVHEITDLSSNTTCHNTYKLIDGISKIEGAIRILEEMNYPTEMLDLFKSADFTINKLDVTL